MLKLLDLHDAIVTIEAMGTQTQIAAQIVKQGGDYVLALKGNQGTLQQDVDAWFRDPVLAASAEKTVGTELGHGRIEVRTVQASEAAWLAERHPHWPNLRSIAAFTLQRSDKKTGKSSVDTRYFISSPSSDVAVLGKAIRGHWSIEDNFHWTLDVAFNEDLCRTPKEHSARNLAMIRRALINLLKRDPLPRSIKRKRFQALINPD